ncbi:hypothetical protein [Streptomyces sp. NPDC008150]|uniref:hypothetical protein n=1 Tax=Streptomyces sp. NPDC008150 TaxID=3364816 RepID=UPI0036E804A5
MSQPRSDADRQLAALQKQLRSTVTDATGRGITVEDIGGGKVRLYYRHVRGDTDERTQDELDAKQQLESRINTIVGHAAEIDDSVARALAKSHGNDAHNAGHAAYESLNDAEVERALELARKGDKMTDAELKELNTLLRYNSGEKDGEFSTEFYQGLGGPEKALQFYAGMSEQGTSPGTAKTRLDEVRDLQKYMGYNLANATDPDHAQHLPASWGTEFRRLGTQPIRWEQGQMSAPYGYQVLGGLLRYGNYDARFLDPIAEHITQLHQKEPYFFLANKPGGSEDIYGFNPSGKLGTGNDPLNSVLEALGHSPEASEKFFTGTPTAYNEDGTINPKGKLDFDSYLDVFTDDDFEWTVNTNDNSILADEDKMTAALNFGPQALGHALESATTGQPYDSDRPALEHTEARSKLVGEIVDKFGDEPGLLLHNENGDLKDEETGPLYAMRGSLGNITAEYMGDFQRAMYGQGEDGDIFPTSGAAAGLDPGRAQRFLGAVGQDPDAYAAITASQQTYTSQAVDNVINGPGSDASLDGRVANAVAPGAAMAGIMSDARADAVYEYHSAKDTEFNESAANTQKWVNRFLGLGIEQVGEKVPVAGTGLEWASEDIQESIMKSIEHDTSSEAEQDAGNEYSSGRQAAIDSSVDAVNRSLMNNSTIDSPTARDLRDAVRVSAGNSHAAGAQWNSESDAN